MRFNLGKWFFVLISFYSLYCINKLNQLLCSVPFTLSILYFRLLMHFLQGDQSESSIKGATSQILSENVVDYVPNEEDVMKKTKDGEKTVEDEEA